MIGFKLSILAVEDGKAHVAQVAKQMAIAVTESGRFMADEINVGLVDKWMTGNVNGASALVFLSAKRDHTDISNFHRIHLRARACLDMLR